MKPNLLNATSIENQLHIFQLLKVTISKSRNFMRGPVLMMINFSILSIILALGSCDEVDADEVDLSDVRTTYEFSYYEAENRTEACITLISENDGFFEVDENILLNEDNHVSFNEVCLEQDNPGPNPYCREFGELVEEGVFQLRLQGVYQNNVTLPPAIDFAGGALTAGQNFELEWEGAPAAFNEIIEVTVTDRAGNTFTEIASGVNGATAIQLSAVNTNLLLTGEARMIIARSIETETINAPAGGRLTTRYEAVSSINVQ